MLWTVFIFIHFPFVPNLKHRAPFGVSVITLVLRHAVDGAATGIEPVFIRYA